jgi:MFS family permease
VLFVGAVGALVTVATAGLVVSRFGGRAAMTVGAAGFAAAFVLLGLGSALRSLPLLATGVFLNGVSFALSTVPLNVESAAIERRMGRTILPQFHAAFSIGAVAGALLGAGAAHLGVSPLSQFVATAVLGTVWRLAAIPRAVLETLPVRELAARAGRAAGAPGVDREPRVAVQARRGGLRTALDVWCEPRTLLIGVVCLAAALSEGSANSWLALAVVFGFHEPQSVGAVVFGLFLAAMTAVRLLGTRLIDRYGRVAVLRASGLVSFVGLLVFGFAPTLALAGAGVVAWGLGAALAVPIAIAAASDDPLRAAGRVSVVSAFGTIASLAAPPLLGLAVESLGYRRALVLIAFAMVASVAVAGRVAPRVPDRDPHRAAALPTADHAEDSQRPVRVGVRDT